MITIKKIIMAMTMVIAGATGTVAEAASNHMKLGGNTSQPIGHAYFCQQFPQECKVKSKRVPAPKTYEKKMGRYCQNKQPCE